MLIQAKMEVGAADDPYEREADRVAAQVVDLLQRQITGEDPEAWTSPGASRIRRATAVVGAEGGIVDGGLQSKVRRAGGGQPLLAHESTHVVPQTSRIRRATTRAALDTTTDAAVAAVRSSIPVRIQRDLGFEYESKSFSTRRTNTDGGEVPLTWAAPKAAADQFFDPAATTRVAKGAALLKKKDIEVQADDMLGLSDLELVTTHFPETNAGRARLDQATQDVVAFLNAGQARSVGDVASAKGLSGAGGFGSPMKDGMISGDWTNPKTSPQVTLGTRLGSIVDLVKDLYDRPGETDNETADRAPGRLKMRPSDPLNTATPKLLTLGEEPHTLVSGLALATSTIKAYQRIDNAAPAGKALKGFLTLIFTYVEAIPHKATFLKNHTPLMAKTDLATMWSTLPAPVRTYYGTTDPMTGISRFERLIETAPGYTAKMDNALFDLTQNQKDTMTADNDGQADQPQWYGGLTLRSWVRGISVRPQPTAGQAFLQFFGGAEQIGVDQLTNKSFPNRPANKEVEGYGALGKRMDKTPKQRGVKRTALPVMELRAINSVVPLRDVGQWSLDVFDYIRSLNANPNGGHTLIQ